MCIVHPLKPDDPAIYVSAQAGCRGCLNTLLAWHEPFVHYMVRTQIWGGVPEDDLLQEGRIALWRAIERYDPQRGAAFSAYASVAIARAVWLATQRERRQRRLVGQADPVDAYLELENGLWREQIYQVLTEASGYLSETEQRVLCLVYGVGGEEASEAGEHLENLSAAGRQLGLTRERVRQARNDALAVLRLPVYSVRLRQLCEQDSREAYLHSRQLSRQWLQKGGTK
jgi:RNA polymerase sigma factor (sigma-70 family)